MRLRSFAAATAVALSLAVISPTPGFSQTTADLALRIDRLEQEVRDLTGMVDELTHQLQLLQQLVDVLRADNEALYQMIGQASGAAPATTVTIPPTITPTTTTPATSAPATTAPAASGAPLTLGAPPANLGVIPAGGQQQPGAPLDLTQALRPDGNFNLNSGAPAGETPAPTTAAGPTPAATVPGSGAPAAVPTTTPVTSGAPATTAAMVPTGNAQADYDTAYQYVLNGDYAQAEVAFNTFLANYPGNPLDVDAQFWVAESLFSRGMYQNAANAFYNAYIANPNHEKAPDMLLKLGISLAQLGQTQSACDTYALLLNRYPDASNALRQRVATEQTNAHC